MKNILELLISIIMILILLEVGFFVIKIILSKRKNQDEDDDINTLKTSAKAKLKGEEFGKFHGVIRRESLLNFLSFDRIEDGMIIRNEEKEYVMVLQCNGINFDLRSENEKLAIEEGFMQFLNTLKNPVQLYVQTRSLNFTDTINRYNERIALFRNEIDKLEAEIKKAKINNELDLVQKLEYEKRKKENLYEYAKDSTEYTKKLNKNKNILQQKTYVVVSYNVQEAGPKVNDFSKDELAQLAFEELYTRCETLAGALSTSGVSSRVLNSEELVELIFNAFNRDELENLNLKEYLRRDYDSLYTKSEDYIEKKKKLIQTEISKAAIELATSSLKKAAKKRDKEVEQLKLEKAARIKEKAKMFIQEHKDELDPKVYKLTQEELDKADTTVYDDEETKQLKAKVKSETKK